MGFNPKGKLASDPTNKEFKLFTGRTDLQVVKFNPSRKEIIEIKNLDEERAAKVQEPQYTNIEIGGKKYTRVELYTYCNPNEILGIEDAPKYQNKHWVQVSFLISNRDDMTSTGKYRFINDKLQTAIATDLDALKGNPNMTEWYDVNTARIAKEGEIVMYELLAAMSNLREVEDFYIDDDPAEAWEELVRGDFDIVNEFLDEDSEVFQNFFAKEDVITNENGEKETILRPRKVAALLGVKTSTKTNAEGKPYTNQVVYTSNNNRSFAKEGRRLAKRTVEYLTENDAKISVNYGMINDFNVYDPGATIQTNQNQGNDVPSAGAVAKAMSDLPF